MSRITKTQFDQALEQLHTQFAGGPITDRQRQAYAATLDAFSAAEVLGAIDTIARCGRPRPWPNEVAAAIHSARPTGQKPGPFLDDDGWREDMVPANEPGWNEAAAAARAGLSAPRRKGHP